MNNKPLGKKAYGSIPHLPGSRLGSGDHHCAPGQAVIATSLKRDRHDRIIVQEKLDGSNVCVAKSEGQLLALTRAGYLANTSPYAMHHVFSDYVESNKERFNRLLNEGERVVGEWLHTAHGTRYILPHEPFVPFDLMVGIERVIYINFQDRVCTLGFISPHVLEVFEPISIEEAMARLGEFGHHGAIDPVEGCVWRVERNKQINNNSKERKWGVDFLVKYVRPDKVDGKYLNCEPLIVNEWPLSK